MKNPRTKTAPKQKEWPIPGDLADLIEDAIGAEALRAVYVKEWFGFKKALRCSKISETKRDEFWAKVYKLYPTLPKDAYYNRHDKVVREGIAP